MYFMNSFDMSHKPYTHCEEIYQVTENFPKKCYEIVLFCNENK